MLSDVELRAEESVTGVRVAVEGIGLVVVLLERESDAVEVSIRLWRIYRNSARTCLPLGLSDG